MKFLVIALLLCTSISIVFPYSAKIITSYLPVVIGSEPREEFDKRIVINYEMLTYINEELPADATVLFLWENRTYYCERDIIVDWHFLLSSIYELLFPPDLSVEEIAKRLEGKYKVTHIFENRNMRRWAYLVEKGPFFADERQERKFLQSEETYEAFKAKYCEKILTEDEVDLFRINYSSEQ